MLLISTERGPEPTAAVVRLPHGVSVQPDNPIFVTTPRDDGFLEVLDDSRYILQCALFSLLSAASVVCKDEEAFSLMRRVKPLHVAFL